jgi:hypothetical protein
VLAGTRLGEEGVEGVIAAANGLVRGHLAVRLDTVLEAVELPARIADLNTGLTDVDGENFTHSEGRERHASKKHVSETTTWATFSADEKKHVRKSSKGSEKYMYV